ncbi:hypothetical protein [Microcella sp.]|uniref:hypothetical protein n=1 Tax=Microcella sp. TaxID=1913979 RepID=UPI00299F70DF|nr:hypothetical protein [Microcella sp.]MDX2024742.1 hypothetical protein [Microcella sp.]
MTNAGEQFCRSEQRSCVQCAPPASTMIVDYSAVASGSIGRIALSFSSSMPQLADSPIELFDAIIESISRPAMADGIEASLDDESARAGDSRS